MYILEHPAESVTRLRLHEGGCDRDSARAPRAITVEESNVAGTQALKEIIDSQLEFVAVVRTDDSIRGGG
jgi:hypothetical protein